VEFVRAVAAASSLCVRDVVHDFVRFMLYQCLTGDASWPDNLVKRLTGQTIWNSSNICNKSALEAVAKDLSSASRKGNDWGDALQFLLFGLRDANAEADENAHWDERKSFSHWDKRKSLTQNEKRESENAIDYSESEENSVDVPYNSYDVDFRDANAEADENAHWDKRQSTVPMQSTSSLTQNEKREPENAMDYLEDVPYNSYNAAVTSDAAATEAAPPPAPSSSSSQTDYGYSTPFAPCTMHRTPYTILTSVPSPYLPGFRKQRDMHHASCTIHHTNKRTFTVPSRLSQAARHAPCIMHHHHTNRRTFTVPSRLSQAARHAPCIMHHHAPYTTLTGVPSPYLLGFRKQRDMATATATGPQRA
jgi:hypothetical protein